MKVAGSDEFPAQQMSARPFATIIVPVYNHERYIAAALDSILAQTDPDWEAIVVDDGSTDATPGVIEQYGARDPRISIVHKPNGGVASALNAGLRRARGKWIHWLSSDDLFEPDKLTINRRWIDANPDVNFFFSYFSLLHDATGELTKHELWGPLPNEAYQILTLFYRNYVSGITICVNRSAWDGAGFFNEKFHYAQDYELWLRILAKNRGTFIPEWTVISRHHAQQDSAQFQEACYYDAAKAVIDFLNRHPFPELVPWVDLTDPAAAAAAVEKAFEIACEPTGFLYALGAHPALVTRILEWLSSGYEDDPSAKSDLQAIARERIRAQALAEGDGDWAWMWRGLAAACAVPNPQFKYTVVDIPALERHEYAARRCGLGVGLAPGEAPLREYLRRFEGIEQLPEPPPGSRSAAVVLLMRPDKACISAASELSQLGFRPVVIAPCHSAYRFDGAVLIIARSSCDRDSLPWLGEVDLVAVPGAEAPPAWIDALAAVSIPEADLDTSDAIADQILTALGFGTTPLRRRTVAFLQRVLWGGGAERLVQDIVRHLDRRRYLPVILTLFDARDQRSYIPDLPAFYTREFAYDAPRIGAPSALPDPGQASDAIPADIAALRHSVVSSFNSYWPAAEGLRNLLCNLGRDAALITVMEEALVTAWVAQIGGKIPYIALFCTVESIYLPQLHAGRYGVEDWAFRNACASAERTISISSGIADDLTGAFGVSPEKSTVIWCSTNCPRVRRSAWATDANATAFGDQHEHVYVHLGRLSPEKDHEMLLQAASLLRSRGRDFIVVCIGAGSERDRIEDEAALLGLQDRFVLVGEWKNPFPMIARAAALVLTSQFEGFGLVLPEAMACGTPVISTDCPGGPRDVLRGGACGMLVPPGDARSLAEAMERIVDDGSLRQRLIEAGFARCEDFAPLTIARRWEEVIDRDLPVAEDLVWSDGPAGMTGSLAASVEGANLLPAHPTRLF